MPADSERGSRGPREAGGGRRAYLRCFASASRTYRNSLTRCRARSFGGAWVPGGLPASAPLPLRLVTHSVCSRSMMLDSSCVSRNLDEQPFSHSPSHRHLRGADAGAEGEVVAVPPGGTQQASQPHRPTGLAPTAHTGTGSKWEQAPATPPTSHSAAAAGFMRTPFPQPTANSHVAAPGRVCSRCRDALLQR